MIHHWSGPGKTVLFRISTKMFFPAQQNRRRKIITKLPLMKNVDFLTPFRSEAHAGMRWGRLTLEIIVSWWLGSRA